MHTQCKTALAARQTAACVQPRAGPNSPAYCASSRAAGHGGLGAAKRRELLGSAGYLCFLSREGRQDQHQPWEGRSSCLL